MLKVTSLESDTFSYILVNSKAWVNYSADVFLRAFREPLGGLQSKSTLQAYTGCCVQNPTVSLTDSK
jgi:hypothetical protein